MRPILCFVLAAAAASAAVSAEAADARLSCPGEVLVAPQLSRAPLDVQLTVQGGMAAPSAITYAWARPEAAVPMTLQGLSGETLSFHGIAANDGAVTVADAQLNRTTLALVLKVRRVGAESGDLTLETTCKLG